MLLQEACLRKETREIDLIPRLSQRPTNGTLDVAPGLVIEMTEKRKNPRLPQLPLSNLLSAF
jgi:hypothetical protein